MWGERVCPGPSGTGCFDLHLGRVGVSAVMVHQGHARSASHWQARSTDLKLSQTPPEVAADVAGSAQLVRKWAGSCLPGDRRPPFCSWPEFRLGHPAEIGD